MSSSGDSLVFKFEWNGGSPFLYLHKDLSLFLSYALIEWSSLLAKCSYIFIRAFNCIVINNQNPQKVIALTISPFLVINDNPIKRDKVENKITSFWLTMHIWLPLNLCIISFWNSLASNANMHKQREKCKATYYTFNRGVHKCHKNPWCSWHDIHTINMKQ